MSEPRIELQVYDKVFSFRKVAGEWEAEQPITGPVMTPIFAAALDELCDFNMICDHLSRTYDHFSEGQISKPNTLPEEVFDIASDKETERTEETLTAQRTEIERLRAWHLEIDKFLGDATVLYPSGVKIKGMTTEALHGPKSPETHREKRGALCNMTINEDDTLCGAQLSFNVAKNRWFCPQCDPIYADHNE